MDCKDQAAPAERAGAAAPVKQQQLKNRSWNMRYIKHLFTRAMVMASLPVLLAAAAGAYPQQAAQLREILAALLRSADPQRRRAAVVATSGWLAAALLAVVLVLLHSRRRRHRAVYIVDFACYKPPEERKCSAELMEWFARRLGVYSDKTMDFFKKVFLKAGVGDETYAPPAMFHHPQAELSFNAAREETAEVIFGALDELFAKTGVRPKDVGILIVNSSCFTPTPSLTSMVVNHYKMSEDVRTFNLGGMGCSAGIIAVDLAKDLLGMHPGSYAVVVSTENITHNLYLGNYRPMLVTNCLFRVGGAAILLTNHARERSRAKYELLHTVRIHNGADDASYGCIMQEEDEQGVVGVNLTKHIMVAAATALKMNLTRLGPMVLPMSEQIAFAANVIGRRFFGSKARAYIPDFKLAFDHFLLHAGGRAVVDELEKSLRLTPESMEPCRMTLYRFGNTSSSCVWYELAYLEAQGRVRWGDRLWQLGVGSGFKCNSAVWRALRDVTRESIAPGNNPWLDCIDDYPLEVPVDAEDVPRRADLHFRTVDGEVVYCHTGTVVHPDGSTSTIDPTPPAAVKNSRPLINGQPQQQQEQQQQQQQKVPNGFAH